MKHSVSLVCLFVIGQVAGRVSIPLQATNTNGANETLFKIGDAVTGKSTPQSIQEDNNNAEESQPEARVSYARNQLWKIFLNNDPDKTSTIVFLKGQRYISVWGGNSASIDIVVNPKTVDSVKKLLDHKNIKYNVTIEDLQKAIDEENPPITEETDDRKGHRLTWKAYHRLQDIYGYLDYLAFTYPDLCTVQNIGNSVQGRPIKLLKISNGNPGNKAIWMDGGIHAREWISPATVTYIVESFTSNYESESQAVRNIDWYIAPLLNPDGYEYSHTVDRLWRKNRARSGRCAGTDLNRNFGYQWGGQGSSKNPCSETYAGTGPFSEPETSAIQRFIMGTSAQWKAYISFHSYGQYILYPWGYNRVVPPDYKDLEAVARKAAAAIRASGGPSYTIGPAGNTLYPASGGSDDWAKGTVHMKYAYTIELRDNGRYGFVLPAAYINPTAKEALEAVRVIAEAVKTA